MFHLGAYNHKIGFFPAIFVQQIDSNNNLTDSICDESLNVTIDQKVPS